MTDKEAMKLALEALELSKISVDNFRVQKVTQEAIAALKERLAQEKALQALHAENERLGLYRDAYAEQEPAAWIHVDPDKPKVKFLEWKENEHGYRGTWIKKPLYTHPPQRTEQNFCSRCGKRTQDIHTCTPPREGT